MIVIPAIDLKGGQCVRLRQGAANDSTVYSSNPVEMALNWQSHGGRFLHVVDLDGAFQGTPVHTEVISKIAAALSIPVEVGGGIRNEDDIEKLLSAGVRRVIIGTRALEGDDFIAGLVKRFGGDRIVVGIDARDGKVQVRGWVQTTSVMATDLAKRVSALGVGTIIYTDTSTDGMLAGPNIPAMREICQAASCDVVASGGVSSPADIKALKEMGMDNLVGAIVGKALYEGRTTLEELSANA